MEIELFSSQFFVALVSIIILDLVLAGDNAVPTAYRITSVSAPSMSVQPGRFSFGSS